MCTFIYFRDGRPTLKGSNNLSPLGPCQCLDKKISSHGYWQNTFRLREGFQCRLCWEIQWYGIFQFQNAARDVDSQSSQSAKLFLQLSKLGHPLPFGSGGHTLLRERGRGSQFGRGHRHCGSGTPSTYSKYLLPWFKYGVLQMSTGCLNLLAKNEDNDPGRIRTCNLQLRRLAPYPLGHRATVKLI
jgi:hypothetical protein